MRIINLYIASIIHDEVYFDTKRLVLIDSVLNQFMLYSKSYSFLFRAVINCTSFQKTYNVLTEP